MDKIVNCLIIDTCDKHLKVALLKNDIVAFESIIRSGKTHSETLALTCKNALNMADILPKELTHIAVCIGPGSFTGVRIGISFAKAMAFALNLKCVALDTLNALAMSISDVDGFIYPVMDARLNSVYNAVFEAQNGVITRLCDNRAIGMDDLLEEIKAKNKPCYIYGDGAYLFNEAKNDNLVKLSEKDSSSTCFGMIKLAKTMIEQEEFTSLDKLNAVYLREPQAVRAKKEK